MISNSIVPIYHTRWDWECIVLYSKLSKTNNTYTHTHTHTIGWGDRHGYEKDSLEIVTEQVQLVGGLKRR